MDMKIINSLRSLGIDMINSRLEGDAGLTISLAPTIYTLFSKHLNFSSSEPTWINRDRFILSTSSASPLLYSTLFYAGYPIREEELKCFGSSKLSIYPEYNPKVGINSSTGIYAEGLSVSVGIALAEKYLRSILGRDLINFYTYVMVSDNEFMSGDTFESLELASNNELSHLIILYNSFETTINGKKSNYLKENHLKVYEDLGFHIETVTNAEDFLSIDKAITRAKLSNKPSIIEIKSLIALGTSLQGSYKGHNSVLTDEDIMLVKEKMNLTKVPFHISANAITEFQSMISTRTNPVYNEWVSRYNKVIETDEKMKGILSLLEEDNLRINIKNMKVNFDASMKEDMLETNNNLMSAISQVNPLMVTCSLFNDNKNFGLKGDKNFDFGNRISSCFNVSIGFSLTGLKPIICTNLVSVSKVCEQIKLASLMKLPITYIFTNDSLLSSNKNMLLMPINELSILRSIPMLSVIKPADVNELVGCYDFIINKKLPTALVLPSVKKGLIPNTNASNTLKGAYIIRPEGGRLSGILVSSGNEVETALRINEELINRGIFTRVVSVPSISLFDKESKEYKDTLFPIGAKVVVIEPSNDEHWNKFVYNEKYLINVKDYVISGKNTEILSACGFDFDSLLEKIEKLLK